MATYYVDGSSSAASDGNSGLSADAPLASLAAVARLRLQPGDTVAFKAGTTYTADAPGTGALVISARGTEAAPITFTRYGSGPAPVIRNAAGGYSDGILLDGARSIVIDGLAIAQAAQAGVNVKASSSRVTIRNVEATNVGEGVLLNGTDNLVTHSYFHDLNMVKNTANVPDDDYGAVGVVIGNSRNEVSYTRIVNARARSYDYGYDGGAIELFGTMSDISIHDNWAENNVGFLEAGGISSSLSNISISNNVSLNSGDFLVIHNGGGNFASTFSNMDVGHNTIANQNNTASAMANVFMDNTYRRGSLNFHDNAVYLNDGDSFFKQNGDYHTNNVFYRLSSATHLYNNWSMALNPGERWATLSTQPGSSLVAAIAAQSGGAGATLTSADQVGLAPSGTVWPSGIRGSAPLDDFGLAQGWQGANTPRQLRDLDGNGSADYVAFGTGATFVASGIPGSAGRTGASFASPAAVIQDFGIDQGYTAEAQRGAAVTGAGVAASIYGQGDAGVYWYSATGRTAQGDAAGGATATPTYDSAPHFYANFGTQQGWTPHNGFQILKTSTSDAYASILGFGNDGIVVGGQAFAPGADASQATVLPASVGNNAGWDQLTDVRTFLDSDGNIVDLNHDGVADFIGMGPQGTVFAYGQEDPSSHQYTLGPVQTATFGGSTDLGRAQGWTDQNTQRLVVHDAVTGTDDILAFGAAGVFVAEGQDPASHGGQPFGALHLAIADFGTNQGWSNALTPRLVGDVNGDGTPDIVGFGASSTFVALGSRDASGHLSFTMDPTKTIGDFGYQEGWDPATTVRALADVDGSGRDSLVLSGYAGTQVWHFT
ncbi:hypothetical protein [Methylobacterium sp. JK268]